ncbi:glycoside hydrolase family 4 [Paenibacillus vortex V453]|jgi:alpha-galactosidase|uniref:Alpha-glucosidase/alpha-galactosidase n=2 Tax=Paenibacillus TaxID=44249 RepID=A0A163KKW3_9BACL|nr:MULTISPECIES: alpha-glucosidase/alpha-galactosidase [Paenibacillus]ANA81267.1 alpha-glucosidase/alpha-galactosidase [Paenibacillus glucanolyticus]AVV60001.1 alpha-glucosidase/alpha-galactosidase [Paenibacillus glucanolyticus]AWP29258.1 alpha-glucosidase/alpha-galactosidase [Paenibacillus sp. Cedars]EFU42373.1 glycoside hydrolase family 4 [Paenibacillus vortex V453]ETT35860.1 alpha-galactosidase [Paenibacillus sp. FSL R5-808]
MSKITFIGAGSTVFAKNVLGDCMQTPALQGFELALFDIDPVRLKDSENMLNNIKKTSGSTCVVKSYSDRKEALRGAKYVVNAIQVGGYDPCTITDFEIPKKYGLRQTIADTVGIGGIFRNLRTIPVMLDFAADIREVCPDALFLNYTNPMAVLTNAMNTLGGVQTVGLCHSVQACIPDLFRNLGMETEGVQAKIAGINHMAWLLEVTKDGVDLYPEIKRRAAEKQKEKHHDMVRLEMMLNFGYYITESSEHNAEYHPYFIKRNYPELIERFNIPLDEYPRRCVNQIEGWKAMREDLVSNQDLTHHRSHEYASYILEAIETNVPFKIGGNVMNTGLITNLPKEACVEVPCLVDASGVTPTYVGDLPPQCAALNRTNINTQLLTLEAAATGKKEHIYHAAMLDPHTAAELSIDDIKSLCDDLIEAHGDWLPKFQ